MDEPDEYNPFGEAKKPPADTLEAYITHSLQRMSGDNLEELVSFRDILGEDVVRYAINAATGLGWEKSTFSYVRGILQNYIKQDIRTVADAKAADAKFKQQKGGGRNGARTNQRQDAVNRGDTPDKPKQTCPWEVIL